MEAKLLLAFTAGLLSFATPCVLPLVPGYLSAVSGTRPGASGRQVVVASLPFVAGFTTVFVARYRLTYPIVHDGPGSSLGRFGLTGFPETWWIDRHGRLVAYAQGQFTEDELRRNTERALGSR